MAKCGQTDQSKAGQRTALIMALTGVLWVLMNLIGAEYDWSNRARGFFDVAALAGFGFALWRTYKLWRARQDEEGGM